MHRWAPFTAHQSGWVQPSAATCLHDVFGWKNSAACSSFVAVADPMPTRTLDAGQARGAVGWTQLSAEIAMERLSDCHRAKRLPSSPVMRCPGIQARSRRAPTGRQRQRSHAYRFACSRHVETRKTMSDAARCSANEAIASSASRGSMPAPWSSALRTGGSLLARAACSLLPYSSST